MIRPDGSRERGRRAGSRERGAVMTERGLLLRVTLLVATASVPLPAPRSLVAQDTTAGKRVYVKWCAGCHGDAGAGDGPAASHMLPRPRDFTGAIYKIRTTASGQLPTDQDVLRSIDEGLHGTPMPSFSDLIDQKFLTDEQLWRVAQYVRSLSPERAPEVRDVIHAPRLLGGLPRSPDDSAWARVERYWFPLVGQVIRKPRWFAPAVAGVWVQAVHTRDSLALRLEWDDRSQSPDTAWLEFQRRVLDHLLSDDSVAARADLQADEIAGQFPRSIPAVMERPYFLMGTATDPVYQWRWTSAPRQAVAGLARGVGR